MRVSRRPIDSLPAVKGDIKTVMSRIEDILQQLTNIMHEFSINRLHYEASTLAITVKQQELLQELKKLTDKQDPPVVEEEGDTRPVTENGQ